MNLVVLNYKTYEVFHGSSRKIRLWYQQSYHIINRNPTLYHSALFLVQTVCWGIVFGTCIWWKITIKNQSCLFVELCSIEKKTWQYSSNDMILLFKWDKYLSHRLLPFLHFTPMKTVSPHFPWKPVRHCFDGDQWYMSFCSKFQ